jgi:hypothetical protein
MSSVQRAAAVAAFVIAGSVASGQGFTAGNGTYVGVALSQAEKDAVTAALDKLQALASAETNAQNQATMQKVIDCVANMNRNGQIGKETGTSTDEATTRTDGSCACEGDEMNINPESLVPGEPACSNLADSLMHEGIHTIQWAMPGGPAFPTAEDKMEWVAYSWGKYVLKKLLMNPNLTAAQKAVLQQKLKGDCGYEQRYCASANGVAVNNIFEFLNEWFAQEGQQKHRLATNPGSTGDWYQATYPFSGRIEIVDGAAGTTLRTIDTQFPVRAGLAAFVTTSGREAVFVGAADAAFASGTLVRFMDSDGDGLIDQASRATFTLPGGAIPIVLVPFGSSLWVLAVTPGAMSTSQLWYIPDTNGDGVPDPAAAVLFASAATMPTLANVRTFRVLSNSQVMGGGRPAGMRIVGSRITYYLFTDTNSDHVADSATTQAFDSTVQAFIPLPIQWMNAGDTLVSLRALPTATVQVLHTDSLGNQIEVLGTSTSASAMGRGVTLIRSLILGEYIVLLDQTHNLRSPTPFQVRAPTAEIVGINLSEVMPGQPVQLNTRSVVPGNVSVWCSGLPATIQTQTPTQVTFIAPAARQNPSGHVAVQLMSTQGTSYPVGLLIDGDCNHNGVSDLQDVLAGTSRDVNLDSIPDECECMADFNGDGVVSVQDIFDFLIAWFAGDPTTRFHGGPNGAVADIFDFLNVWFAGCLG